MIEAPLAELCGALDAIKIDLKGYNEAFYRDVCGAELKAVIRSIRQIAKSRTHLEIVNLVVPTLNDSERMLKGLIDWVLTEVGPDVPVHFTRFHPDYQMLDRPPTPHRTLVRAWEIGKEAGLRYVYVGNVHDGDRESTFCPSCGALLVSRNWYTVRQQWREAGVCHGCGAAIPGVWK